MARTLPSTPEINPEPPTMKAGSITAVILTKNEEPMIANCLETLGWCDQILVFDTGSTDRTPQIAEQMGCTVVKGKSGSFADWRNAAAKHVTTEWLFYIDADERTTPQLAKAIMSRIQRPDFDAYRLRRNNIMWGRWFQFGGWNTDSLLRLVRKARLQAWVGDVHEHAEVVGRVGEIEEPLVHLTHRSLYDGLRKSVEWTDIEAHLFLEANHPRVGPLRLVKIIVFDFFHRLIIKQAWKDGAEGVIEAMIQTMNRFLVYTRLWELQQKPSIPERYQRIESEITKQWQDAK